MASDLYGNLDFLTPISEMEIAKVSRSLKGMARELEVPVVRGGTYLAMEGPQVSMVKSSGAGKAWQRPQNDLTAFSARSW